MFYTYIVECADGTLYTGWTTDLEKRIETHNKGTGARYTRARLPLKLVCAWSFPSKQEAMSWEYEVKRLSRDQKQKLYDGTRHCTNPNAKLLGIPA